MPGTPPPAPPGASPEAGTPPPAPPVEGGGIGEEIGFASGALLGPAALGSLAKAVQRRASQAPSEEGPYWFYVEQPTPLLALDEYREIGEFVPGSWYLAQGTYGDWIHASNERSTAEGWIPGWAAKRAPS